eukprot:766454-Hanusia_phi.AAC.11
MRSYGIEAAGEGVIHGVHLLLVRPLLLLLARHCRHFAQRAARVLSGLCLLCHFLCQDVPCSLQGGSWGCLRILQHLLEETSCSGCGRKTLRVSKGRCEDRDRRTGARRECRTLSLASEAFVLLFDRNGM